MYDTSYLNRQHLGAGHFFFVLTKVFSITSNKQCYLTFSKIVSHFKHVQNREMQNKSRHLSLSFERKLNLILIVTISGPIYGTPIAKAMIYTLW